LFVTGTDTGVGKTRVAAGLCRVFALRGERVAAMKPVAAGCMRTAVGLRNVDALVLQAAMNVRASYDDVNPYSFEPAIAPHLAAAEAGVSFDFELLDRAYARLQLQSDIVLVEGAGGWLVPLDAEHSMASLAVRWQLDVLLVVGMRLGCLNHALLTVEAVELRGLRLAGWIANCIDPTFERAGDNVAWLRERLTAPCLGVLPFAPDADADAVSRRLTAPSPTPAEASPSAAAPPTGAPTGHDGSG
jgi:dethiobiotin synthetase